MSFLYPRTVTLGRENQTTTAGLQAFQEFTPAQLTIYAATPVPCSIQLANDGGKPLGDVPGDTRARGVWKVFISAGNATAAGIAASGAVRDRDTVIDDAGIRYQVTHAYWNSLGWQLRCERLEA